MRKPAAKSTTEKVRETVQERVVEPAKKASETIKATVTGAAGASVDFGTRMIDQAEENAREAFNAMRAAAKAKDLSEVMKVQAEYLKEQGSRSVKQAREIGELIAQFGRDAIAPIRRG